MASFTLNSSATLRSIVTPCAIAEGVPLNDGLRVSRLFETQTAMWDTGSTHTLITPQVVDYLNLQPIGKAQVTNVNGDNLIDVYRIHVSLPNGRTVLNIKAILSKNSLYDVVIGMDIISKGDFALTNPEGKSTFSFRMPSQERIVFVD